MKYRKLQSTLEFDNNAGESVRYEIFQDHDESFFAVISVQEELEGDKFGRGYVWHVFNSHVPLRPSGVLECEEECKAHFLNSSRQ